MSILLNMTAYVSGEFLCILFFEQMFTSLSSAALFETSTSSVKQIKCAYSAFPLIQRNGRVENQQSCAALM